MSAVDAVVTFISTAFGVFLGLILHHYRSDRKDRRVYQAIANSIQSEAKANKDALIGSFEKFAPIRRGVVLNEFRLDSALNSLANPLFVRKAKPGDIVALNTYVRHLAHANNYARMKRELVTANTPDVAERFDEPLREAWNDNLKVDWDAIDWRFHEQNVIRLRRRIFKATRQHGTRDALGACLSRVRGICRAPDYAESIVGVGVSPWWEAVVVVGFSAYSDGFEKGE